jgi:hypothetical protein
MREKPTNTPIINSVYKLWMVAPTCFGITLPSSGSVPSAFWDAQLSSSRQNIVDRRVVSSGVVRAPQLSISQKALGTLPEDGNVMSKHVGATIHNQLTEWIIGIFVGFSRIY